MWLGNSMRCCKWLPFFAEKMDTTKMSGSGCLTQNLEVKIWCNQAVQQKIPSKLWGVGVLETSRPQAWATAARHTFTHIPVWGSRMYIPWRQELLRVSNSSNISSTTSWGVNSCRCSVSLGKSSCLTRFFQTMGWFKENLLKKYGLFPSNRVPAKNIPSTNLLIPPFSRHRHWASLSSKPSSPVPGRHHTWQSWWRASWTNLKWHQTSQPSQKAASRWLLRTGIDLCKA